MLTFDSCRLPACFARNGIVKHPPSTKRVYSLRSRHVRRSISSSIAANFRSPKNFPFFSKLPQELRMRIWEMTTEDGRIVAVRSVTGDGLRSSVPPILHVYSESRAGGLKQYALRFSAIKYPFSEDTSTIPARVYFNFDRDTLYFRENWHEGVYGVWCCTV